MSQMFIFGLGYTASRFADCLRAQGWIIHATGSAGDVAFADAAAVTHHIARATHILSSVPPGRDGIDPVLNAYGRVLHASDTAWIGYLSSTGVYGDTKGSWVDESAPIGQGRRTARSTADLDWQRLSETARVFRLPGIYGPGRSALERVRDGKAHRIALPDQIFNRQIFSRVHVDDIIGGLLASLNGPAGVYNLADDYPCSQNRVIEEASVLLHIPPPPIMTLEQANLSPQALAFYAENRRVANGKAKRLLGWQPLYPTFARGLRACLQTMKE